MPRQEPAWRWSDCGTIERILGRLRIKLDNDGHIDWDVWCGDCSAVRARLAVVGVSEYSKNNQMSRPTTL